MNCYLCNTQLKMTSNIDMCGNDLYYMITFLDCPKCNAAVEVYHPKDQQDTASCQCSIR